MVTFERRSFMEATYMMEQISASAVVETAMRDRWDYIVVTIHARHDLQLQEGLQERGLDGWELVFISQPTPNDYQCVFRRRH